MSSKPSRPITWQIMLAVVGIVALVTAAMRTHDLPSWMPPFWLDVGRTARESMLLVAPIVAAIAAWVGGWNHTIVIGPTPGRPQSQLVATRFVPLTVAAVVGQWLGLVPPIVDATLSATGGGLPWTSVLSANVELAAAIGIGFLTGVVVRSRLAPVVAAVGMFLMIWLTVLVNDVSAGTGGEQGLSVLSVAWTWVEKGASAGSVDNVAVNLARTVLFGMVGIACFAVASAWADTYRSRRGAAASLFLAPLALAAAMLAIQPELSRPIDAERCEVVGTTPAGGEATVCVTPDVIASLEPTAAGVHDVISRFGFGATPADAQASGDLSSSSGYIWRPFSREEADAWMHDEAVRATASTVAGVSSCAAAATNPNVDLNEGGRLADQQRFVNALAYEIAHRTVIDWIDLDQSMYRGPNDFGLESWSDAELREFIATHADGLATCSISGP